MTDRIDVKDWICSEHMAAWVQDNIELDAAELIDCICIAPHRTMREKLKELKKLCKNTDDISRNLLKDRIERMETALSEDPAEKFGQERLCCMNIYYRGQKEEMPQNMFFRTKKAAVEAFLEYIQRNVREKEDTADFYYAVVSILSLKAAKQQYQCVEQLIVRFDGEIICSRETMGDNFSCQRLPYPSGTILSNADLAFLPPIKGVLVNQEEPEEDGFAENDYGQWLICPPTQGRISSNGICLINLTDHYDPFSDTDDCDLPYKQLLSVCEDSLGEQEQWIAQLSQMIKKDKTIMNKMLHDRRPERMDDLAKRRLAYVRSLSGFVS